MNGLDFAKTINERRQRHWMEAQTFLDRIHAEGRTEMTAEERAQWDRYNDAITDCDSEREMFLSRERRENENAQLREMHPGVFGSFHETRAVEWSPADDMLRRLVAGDPFVRSLTVPLGKAAREREMLRDGASASEIRSLVWDTGNIASAVPVTTARSMYEILEAEISMLSMPTTKIVTQSGESMMFPRMTTHEIGTHVIAQGTAIGGTDPAFSRLNLNAYKYGALLQISSEVMQDTVVGIEALMGRDLGRALGRLVDTDLVVGTGTGQPLGIMTSVSGAGTIATGGSLITPTYEKLVDLVYSVNSGYRARNSVAWLMSDQCAGQLRKLRVGAGGTSDAPLWQPTIWSGITAGQPDRLLGYPFYTDPNVASCGSNARIMAYGDFNAYYVRQVGDPVIERSDDFAFNVDLVTLRAKWRVDGSLIDTNGAINIMKQSV